MVYMCLTLHNKAKKLPYKRVHKNQYSSLSLTCLTSSLPLFLSFCQHKSPSTLLSSFFSGFFHIQPVGCWWITERRRRLIFCVRLLRSMVAPCLQLFRYHKLSHGLLSVFLAFSPVTPLAQSSNPIKSLIALLASPWQQPSPTLGNPGAFVYSP